MFLAAVLSAWLQYAADGKPHARARVPLTCPAVTYGDGSAAASAPMRKRAGTAPHFDEAVCDAPLPANATNVAVEGVKLPSPARAPHKIVVFGDTGCRMKDQEQQNCGDPADWPFPRIAQRIAAEHADLAVHVGDYYYRESNCPAVLTKCLNRWGDTSASWDADWFAPGKPLFASTPLVLVRGNHEECRRGGSGWYRYLDANDPLAACPPADAPAALDGTPAWAADFDGLRIVAGDSAADPSDDKLDPGRVAYYRAQFGRARALAAGASGDAWFVTHRPPYANTNETHALLDLAWNLAPFGVLLSGHVHDFEAINVAGRAPLIVNGESGDALDPEGDTAAGYMAGQKSADGRAVYALAAPGPFTSRQFGYAVYTRSDGGAAPRGWTISLRDVDGIERHACALVKGTVSCN